ncbi:HAMP domain-containing sensor histidine kinase [Aquimarina sp. 2201CG5-10]|uniref:sensor histidine kinase n=1 Tax=Aquimarina callyspongiae TaxID=3098150 RepID=UPI002AB35A52|nr:HAMP domain-containing sensor histidine kinase [Aquimarina sp. 2201CG5-10]MDY8136547.1 HAMP domain-containing sensor histidine kinase [Aquimarina sp. 2201CG5-10]
MKRRNYKTILYFITAVIVVTLSIQVYWNLKNYQASKQQLINEVQISLDNAVDQYYEELAKNQTFRFISDTEYSDCLPNNLRRNKVAKIWDSTPTHINDHRSFFRYLDSTKAFTSPIIKRKITDSTHPLFKVFKKPDSIKTMIQINDSDSITIYADLNPFEILTSKVVVSIGQDDLELKKIDSLLKFELSRKKVSADYILQYTDPLGQSYSKNENSSIVAKEEQLYTVSKSSYLPYDSSLKLFFTNTTRIILERNLFGILLSFLLVSAVIGCLLYLLRIINRQKQLAELKNDLISNITHEFKTPIATISAAMEGIRSFNQANDPQKTKKYVEMSSNQLGKLNTMVEKILETATLDSDELQLNLEEANMVELIDNIIEKHKTNSPQKNITFESTHSNIWKKIDVFHFENAVNNIIDNAIKYGGDLIAINIKNTNPNIHIEIKDNGNSLTKTHKEKIFEKFYRVPKGNTHDIKGFGIGLFYTKTIIEKHKGNIQLLLDQGQTNFKITLPNG